MPFSHHSHSGQFCRHAKGSLSQVIESAISKRFRTFGLSEHCPRYRTVDLYPEEVRDVFCNKKALFKAYTLFLVRFNTFRY